MIHTNCYFFLVNSYVILLGKDTLTEVTAVFTANLFLKMKDISERILMIKLFL